jgi:hypothetical protein
LHARQGGEAIVVELLKCRQVAGHDAQEVVGVAEEPLGLQDLGDLSNGLFECSEGVTGRIAHGDGHERFEVEAECRGVEVGAVGADGAGAFESA